MKKKAKLWSESLGGHALVADLLSLFVTACEKQGKNVCGLSSRVGLRHFEVYQSSGLRRQAFNARPALNVSSVAHGPNCTIISKLRG